MNDRRPPYSDDDATLSAYLAGELPDDEVAVFEQRLATEPALAAHLDGLADALVSLGGADTVTPPDGFAERLSRRLSAESTVGDLAQRRAARARRSSRWMVAGTAAAVVVLGAVMAGGVLRGLGGGGGDADMETADSARDAQGGAVTAGPPPGPVIVDENVKLAGQAALRRRYRELPEVQSLLGVGVDEAVDIAAAYAEAVPGELQASQQALAAGESAGAGQSADTAAEDLTEAAAAPEAETRAAGDGDRDESSAPAPPAALQRCLSVITEDAEKPLVPARIETVRYDGRRAIVYVLITATPNSRHLDRTEVWVVARSDCTTLVFQQS